MNQEYTPDKVWKMKSEQQGGAFAGINRPTAGSREQKDLPRGNHPLQLYSLATPNGVKVTIMLEELLELGVSSAEYDAFLIDIGAGDQFGSGFVDINPNSKIPALLDLSEPEPVKIFESGSILVYLAEKFGHFLPRDRQQKTTVLNWLFWQVGSGPFIGGGFGHFYHYAPVKLEYPIDRFAMEAKRQLDVLDKQLAHSAYVAGEQYSIADMAIFPWYGALVKGKLYDAAEYLAVNDYSHIQRWADDLLTRPAVLRGRLVNKGWGEDNQQLIERHSQQDFARLDTSFR